jgi:hypothetical protein
VNPSYATILIILISLFFFGLFGHNISSSDLMRLGIGTVDPRSFIYGWGIPTEGIPGLISNVFVANSPQPILSTIYYTYNSLFTCFMLGSEWNGYGSVRKGLRVSGVPRGAQRTSYFLQLPYKWALPLMVLSGTLHWLVSQSIFLVSVQFDHGVEEGDGDFDEYLTCGYSPPAILATILVGMTMIGGAILMGRRTFRNAGMPIAGSCSASISACCHLPDQTLDNSGARGPTSAEIQDVPLDETSNDVKRQRSMHSVRSQYSYTSVFAHAEDEMESGQQAASLPVKWGVTGYSSDKDTEYSGAGTPGVRSRVGHCAFSSREVDVPTPGDLYAGT